MFGITGRNHDSLRDVFDLRDLQFCHNFVIRIRCARVSRQHSVCLFLFCSSAIDNRRTCDFESPTKGQPIWRPKKNCSACVTRYNSCVNRAQVAKRFRVCRWKICTDFRPFVCLLLLWCQQIVVARRPRRLSSLLVVCPPTPENIRVYASCRYSTVTICAARLGRHSRCAHFRTHTMCISGCSQQSEIPNRKIT